MFKSESWSIDRTGSESQDTRKGDGDDSNSIHSVGTG